MSILHETLRAHRERRKRLFESGYVPPPPPPPPESPQREPIIVSEDEFLTQMNNWATARQELGSAYYRMRANRHEAAKRLRRLTAENFGITEAELVGDNRRHCYVIPRHIFMYILVRCLIFTTPQTGKWTGGKDHSTVVNGIKSIQRRMIADPAIRARAEYLVKACGLAPMPSPEVTQ